MSFICITHNILHFTLKKSKMPLKKYMCVIFVMSLNVVKSLKVAKRTYIYKTWFFQRSFNTKVSCPHVSYIPSLPSSGDCLTLFVEADFSMDGSDLLTSQLTSESCPWDLKGFYLLYSHIHNM